MAQIGMGPYITEDNTPVAKMWAEAFPEAVADKQAHMAAMFELTTRMVALVRITLGNANVTATTALQVRIATHSAVGAHGPP